MAMTREIHLQCVPFDNLDEKLREIQSDENPLLIDMRYNHLGAMCLPILLKWLSCQHEETKICVGFTNIGISEICKALVAKMGNVEWVMNGRISIDVNCLFTN